MSHSAEPTSATFCPKTAADAPMKLAMQELVLAGRILPVGGHLVVRHTFTSGEKAPAEIVYAFVLPRDAALRRFRIEGTGFSMNSELRPKQEATEEYEKGIANGHLSSLASLYRDGYVNLNVGNIRPGETVTVLLEIMAGVDLRDDGLRFRFPFTLSPVYHAEARYTECEAGTTEMELPAEAFGDIILPPFRHDPSNLHRVSFNLLVDMPQEIAETASPSHALRVETQTMAQARIQLAVDGDVPNRDLVLDVRLKKPFSGILGGLDRAGHGQFAAVMASGAFSSGPGAAPRRLVFLLDRSGSMEGENIKQAKQAVLACIGALSAEDQIGFVSFDNQNEAFRDTLSPATDAIREALRQHLKDVDARGGTELLGGILAAAKMLDGQGDIMLVTDGQVAGLSDILAKITPLGIRVHCLGIGSASQDRLLSSLAAGTHAISRFVTSHERVDVAALELFSSFGRPVLSDVLVSADAPDAVLHVGRGAIYTGHPLVIHGSSTTASLKLSIAGVGSAGPSTLVQAVVLKASPLAESVRLFRGARLITLAENAIEGPADQGVLARRTRKRQEDQLLALGGEYGLANQMLFLVAVVKRAGDRPGDVPVTTVVPVGFPEDVDAGAYGSPAAPAARMMDHRSSRIGEDVHCYCIFDSSPRLQPKRPARVVSKLMSFCAVKSSSWPTKLASAPQESIQMDLCMSLSSMLTADGGMPGSTRHERVLASIVALLTLAKVRATENCALFDAHMARLTAFLSAERSTGGDCGVSDQIDRCIRMAKGSVDAIALARKIIAGKIIRPADVAKMLGV